MLSACFELGYRPTNILPQMLRCISIYIYISIKHIVIIFKQKPLVRSLHNTPLPVQLLHITNPVLNTGQISYNVSHQSLIATILPENRNTLCSLLLNFPAIFFLSGLCSANIAG